MKLDAIYPTLHKTIVSILTPGSKKIRAIKVDIHTFVFCLNVYIYTYKYANRLQILFAGHE